MSTRTDDVRIRSIAELSTPLEVALEHPSDEVATATVAATRSAIHDILSGTDDRLLVVIGPCSIHDSAAALDYAKRLTAIRQRIKGCLEIVMRVYFEKPRTTTGWKGLINDPNLDGTFQINKGLRIARGLLVEINRLGVPAGCEFLDMVIPQYLADLVSWGAIGARTTESQVHRELASGLSCPVGFKNGTDGDVSIAIDALRAASQPHHFLAVTKQGRCAIAATRGNSDCHVILRGGARPNHDAASVGRVCESLVQAGLRPAVMIDVSHGNSGKNHENQPAVAETVAQQIEAGDTRIVGLMIESNLEAGRQDYQPRKPLKYGQSITDACIDWGASVKVLDRLFAAIEERRRRARHSSAT